MDEKNQSPWNGSFQHALHALQNGKKIARTGWNGKGMYLGLQLPDEGSMNKKPYIFIILVDGQRVPWVASHGDLLGTDWEVID